MSPRAVRLWYWTHKWSSLVCTLFLLMLCVTGLPLIFHAEIDAWLDEQPLPPLADMPAEAPRLSLDVLVDSVKRLYPAQFIHWVGIGGEKPEIWVGIGPDGPEPGPGKTFRIDARSGEVLELPEESEEEPSLGEKLMVVAHGLHTDLFSGFTGEIVLCLVGALFVISTASGAFLYGPFMRNLEFGTVRANGPRRVKWLDLHNLLGVATLAWALMIGLTGAFNTMSGVMLDQWQSTTVQQELGAFQAEDREPVVEGLSSLQAAVDSVQEAAPGMRVTMVVYPNRRWVSPDHYLLWAWGTEPMTAKLRIGALVEARTGEVATTASLPWYMTLLDLARPLHFGDYGGMPLKVLWAAFDIVLIIVLASGLYLFVARRAWTYEPRGGSV